MISYEKYNYSISLSEISFFSNIFKYSCELDNGRCLSFCGLMCGVVVRWKTSQYFYSKLTFALAMHNGFVISI